MDRRTVFVALLCAVAMSACTTVTQETRVASDIQAHQFNSVAGRYMARPTFVHVERRNDGLGAVRLSFTQYSGQESRLAFTKPDAAAHAALLRKFAEWDAQAKAQGDSFTKEIGRAPTVSYGGSAEIRHTFHSASASVHFIALAFCAAGTCLDAQSAYLDAKSAARLAEILDRLAAGQLVPKDVGAAYR